MIQRNTYKSYSNEWRTPQALYDALHAEFGFEFDACPMDTQSVWDSLILPWSFPAFCNPPYSRLADWVAKAYEESKRGTVVLLIPARTDTKWWHDYVMHATEIRFIKGRLRFGDAKNSAPFPSCVVVFRGTS